MKHLFRPTEHIAEQEARYCVAMHLRSHPEDDLRVARLLYTERKTWLEIAESLSIPVPTAAPETSRRPGRTTASSRREARAARAAKAAASGRAVAAGAA